MERGHTEAMGEGAKRADAHVCIRIRERRTSMGLTQQDVADALKVSYQQFQKYEIGANRVSAGRLYEIAMRLEVDVGYFFDGLEPTSEGGPIGHVGKDRSTIEMVRDFSAIGDPALRSAVGGVVRALSGKTRGRGRTG